MSRSSPQSLAPLEPAIPSGGDAHWFREEAHLHDAKLKSYVRRSFPGVRDVDDLVQESYLRLLRTGNREPIRLVKAFLFRVVRHLAIDHLRRSRISPIDEVENVNALPVAEDTAGAVERMIAAERYRLVVRAIAALPSRCRESFVLCKVQGMSHAGAAKLLGVSERTVDEQVLRGMRRLGELVKRQETEG